jgi:hypothetical protein
MDAESIELAALLAEARADRDRVKVQRILSRLAELEPDRAVAGDHLRERARILEELLGDIDAAVEVWAHVLDAEPAAHDAIGALCRLFESRGDWVSLVDVKRRQAEVETDPVRARAVWQRIAEIYRVELGDEQAANEALARAAMQR